MLLSATTTSVSGQAKRKRDLEGTPEISEHLTYSPRKRPHLTLSIGIPSTLDEPDSLQDDDDRDLPISGLSEPDSLFDEATTLSSPSSPRLLTQPICRRPRTPALLTAPPIQGLFFTPTLELPEDIARSVTRYCIDTYFYTQGVNQVMLFGRFHAPESTSAGSPCTTPTGLPPVLLQLLAELETMLLPTLPSETHSVLFPRVPTRARQAILNMYQPGEGITPHIDLLRRYGDGIIGVSLGSGCVMQFAKVGATGGMSSHMDAAREIERDSWDVYLPERSVIVLSEDARYGWTHGIGKETRDYVSLSDVGIEGAPGTWIERGVRLSITFRWLLPGADVVGDEPTSP